MRRCAALSILCSPGSKNWRLKKEIKKQRKESVSEPAASVASSAAPQVLPQAKSVRISLERLDRMMNAVGELVINRTRMVGRLSELAKLVEVLTFSKGRLSGKVSEFQDKHEFSKINPSLMSGASYAPQMDTFRPNFAGGMPLVAPGEFAEFSDLEMDRYDDFN